jgi:hypothetical protein
MGLSCSKVRVGSGRRSTQRKAARPLSPAAVTLAALALFAALTLQAPLAGAAGAAAPTVESEAVSDVSATDATLEARIDPQSAERGAYYQFQLVRDPSEYLPKFACPSDGFPGGSSLCLGLESEPHALALGLAEAGTQPLKVSLDVSSTQPYWASSMTLEPSTTYHYRVIVARSKPSEDEIEWEEPIVYGADQTFTTPAAPPPPPPPPPPSGSPPPSGEGSTPSAPAPVPVALASQEVKPQSAPVAHHRKHKHKRRHKHRRHRHHAKHQHQHHRHRDKRPGKHT